MTAAPESHTIARYLAAAPWHQLRQPDRPDGRAVSASTVHIEADGDTVTVTVTDADGTKREYRAQVTLIGGAP